MTAFLVKILRRLYGCWCFWTELHVGRFLVTCTVCWETRPHLEHVEDEVWNRQCLAQSRRSPPPELHEARRPWRFLSNKQTWSKACSSRFVHADLRSVGALEGTTFLRCRTRFVSCCRTSARRRVPKPRPTLARNPWNAPRDHTHSSLKDVQNGENHTISKFTFLSPV